MWQSPGSLILSFFKILKKQGYPLNERLHFLVNFPLATEYLGVVNNYVAELSVKNIIRNYMLSKLLEMYTQQHATFWENTGHVSFYLLVFQIDGSNP